MGVGPNIFSPETGLRIWHRRHRFSWVFIDLIVFISGRSWPALTANEGETY